MFLNLRISLCALISFILLFSCNQTKNESTPLLPNYVNDDWVKYETDTYSLFFPDSLNLDTNFLNLEFIIRSNQLGESDFMENLNLDKSEINRDELVNLDKSISESIETYLNGQITESSYKEINGIKYKFDKCETSIKERDYTFLIYNHIIDTTIYQLTVTMQKDASTKYAPIFEQIIGTVHFNK